jgi:hypothetical protein
MADLSVTPLQYQAPKGMSLGELMNIASSAQQLQQAQQLNPLQLQKAQLELEQAQQMNPLAVGKSKVELQKALRTLEPEVASKEAESRTAQANARFNELKLTGAQRQTALEAGASMMPHKIVTEAASLPENASKEQIKKHQDSLVNLIENEFVPRLKAAGMTPSEIATQRLHLEQAAIADPRGFQSHLQRGTALAGGAQTLATQNLPTVREVTGAPLQTVTPSIAQAKPVATQQTPVTPNENLPPRKTFPNAPASGVSSMEMELPYSKRGANEIKPYAPGEKEDETKGIDYRSKLLDRQTKLPTETRNLQEVIQTAMKLDPGSFWTSGGAGAALRTLRTFVGDPIYKQLSKDLANVQISNMQAMGMSTDADKSLTAAATGEVTYPPEILIDLARRYYGDATRLDMESNAIDKFQRKFGDNNAKAFRKVWNANADSKVFQAITIYNTVKDPKERTEAIDSLLGKKPNPDNYKDKARYQEVLKAYNTVRGDFTRKFDNIMKLSETGEL